MRPEFRLRLSLEAALSLSEDPPKVLAAMKGVVGEARCSIEEGMRLIRITSDDQNGIDRFHDQLRDRRVRGVARKLLFAGRQGDKTKVMLNRQAATVGVIALCGSEEESPLGPIYLSIESEELDEIIRWLTAYEAG